MKIIKLEAIRGFVAIYVVIHHLILFTPVYSLTPFILKMLFRFGREAVLIFFLLSGFVICVSMQKNRDDSFYNYFKKRALRIYPILLMTFLLSAVTFLVNGYNFSFMDFKSFLGNVFQLQRMEDEPGFKLEPFLGNFPLWSLGYEWWFYMLFFPLFHFFKKQNNSAVRNIYIILILSLVSWLFFLLWPDHFFLVLNSFLLWWAGFYCAEVYLEKRNFFYEDLKPVLFCLLLMSIIMGLPIAKSLLIDGQTVAEVNTQFPLTNYLYNYIEAFLLIITGLAWWKIKLFKFDLIFGPFAKLAPISYAIYVVHFPIILLKISFIENIYLILLVKLFLTFGISYLLEIIFQPWVVSQYKRIGNYKKQIRQIQLP